MQEHHPAPAPTPRGASRKRKLSSPSEAAVVMMDSSDRGQLQERNSRVKDDFSGDPSHNIAGQDRYMLLACGCNLYGQLSPMRANMRSGNEQGTADNKFKKIGDDDDGSAMQNASSVIAQDPAVRGIFNDVDMDNSDSRRSAPPTIIDTPTAILGASESLRVLYVGFNCICVERDGTLFIQGLPVKAVVENKRRPAGTALKSAFKKSKNGESINELPIPLPKGVLTHTIFRGFGTRWAFLGIILTNGDVYIFDPSTWSLNYFQSPMISGDVLDIQINRQGDVCILQSIVNEEQDESNKYHGNLIQIYAPVPYLSRYLHDASMDSFINADPTPISEFSLSQIAIGDGSDSMQLNSVETFTKIQATSTGFMALTSSGRVYTYGDPRYNSLGRATTSQDKANGWGLVDSLDGLNITQISSNPGGIMQLALAEDGTAYIWGTDGTHKVQFLPRWDSEDEIGMIDIPSSGVDSNEEDVLSVEFGDLACGEDHVVLVEKGGMGVWVAGESDAGQLGFGVEYETVVIASEESERAREKTGLWRRWKGGPVNKALRKGRRIKRVDCGFQCTLVVIDTKP